MGVRQGSVVAGCGGRLAMEADHVGTIVDADNSASLVIRAGPPPSRGWRGKF